ncbi:glutathione S-transferase [Agrocybe pediades]|nr:glutathione S-transferase [Agrocybe pediades]
MSASPQFKKPLTLYTCVSPNGQQTCVFLEELKEAYPGVIDYEVVNLILKELVQKEPWFLKLNPNGRVPVLVDHTCEEFPVFESSAIMLYLAQRFDKNHVFWFDVQQEPAAYSEMLQWIFFAHGGLAPMEGQAGYFATFCEVDIPYCKKRYTDEVKRLFGVLEVRLQGRDYLVGSGKGKYSLADMKAYPWVRVHQYTGIEDLDPWPAVKAWTERCEARPAVRIGLEVGRSPQASLYLKW